MFFYLQINVFNIYAGSRVTVHMIMACINIIFIDQTLQTSLAKES